MSLLLHCGATETTRQDVINVPTPENTDTFFPVPHSELLDYVERNLQEAGLSVVGERHGLTKEGQRYFGTLEVRNGQNSDDYGLLVGIRNGHDKMCSAGLALGSRVFVCDNMSFSGEVTLKRSHTKNIKRDLPSLVARAVGKLQDHRQIQDSRFEAYKGFELDNRDANDFVVRAARAKAIAPRSIIEVLDNWEKPPHEEFEARNLWALFNSFTEIYKSQPEVTVLRRSQILHGLADSRCGLVCGSEIIEDGTLEVAV